MKKKIKYTKGKYICQTLLLTIKFSFSGHGDIIGVSLTLYLLFDTSFSSITLPYSFLQPKNSKREKPQI